MQSMVPSRGGHKADVEDVLQRRIWQNSGTSRHDSGESNSYLLLLLPAGRRGRVREAIPFVARKVRFSAPFRLTRGAGRLGGTLRLYKRILRVPGTV